MPVEQKAANPLGLTREIVQQAVKAVREVGPRYSWGKAELRDAVLEVLVTRFGLQLIEISTGPIANLKDPRVQELSRQLNGFKDLLKI